MDSNICLPLESLSRFAALRSEGRRSSTAWPSPGGLDFARPPSPTRRSSCWGRIQPEPDPDAKPRMRRLILRGVLGHARDQLVLAPLAVEDIAPQGLRAVREELGWKWGLHDPRVELKLGV